MLKTTFETCPSEPRLHKQFSQGQEENIFADLIDRKVIVMLSRRDRIEGKLLVVQCSNNDGHLPQVLILEAYGVKMILRGSLDLVLSPS